MPFKSKAQRRKFAELLVKGEITPETYEEWNRETGGTELPERVNRARKKSRKKKAGRTTANRKTATRKTAKRKTAKRQTAKRKSKKR
jgi:hypothetical protein